MRFRSLALATAASAVLAGSASASSGGGLSAPGTPEVDDAVCLTRCVSDRKATPGATVQIRGVFLSSVSHVVFRGADGPLRARSIFRNSGQVKAVVPAGSISSRVYVVDEEGNPSNPSPRKLAVLPPSQIPESIFPVRGPHEFWDGFGAGRNHMGTDVGAACGTRVVSAVAGRVEFNTYQSAAGNYLVIDSKGSPDDLAYMHLIKPGIVEPGQKVSAGQTIGYVGETGRASGCHLHFEYWEGDWYGGGMAVDSEPFLRELDRKS